MKKEIWNFLFVLFFGKFRVNANCILCVDILFMPMGKSLIRALPELPEEQENAGTARSESTREEQGNASTVQRGDIPANENIPNLEQGTEPTENDPEESNSQSQNSEKKIVPLRFVFLFFYSIPKRGTDSNLQTAQLVAFLPFSN